jgi:hypothetical protein
MMGIQKKNSRRPNGFAPPWTKREDDILRNHYVEDGAEACALLLPGRTIEASRTRAKLLNLAYLPRKLWTERDVGILTANAGKVPASVLVRMIPRHPRSSIIRKAAKLGLPTWPGRGRYPNGDYSWHPHEAIA